MKQKQVVGAMFCAAISAAHAATTDTLDQVVVTATRTSQPLTQSLASTSVITRQNIQASQAIDVPSLLRTVAGVELAQNGGFGKTASLFLRGSNAPQVLVLLDGMPINTATTGTASVQELMLDEIERIEVVRGNVSSVYGSQAIGGVVQIFTRRGRGAPHLTGNGGLGSQGTQRLSLGFGGAVADTDFNVQASGFRTNGVSALNPALAPSANPDSDGYRNVSLSANMHHAFNADHGLSATLFGSHGDNQYDNAFGLPTDRNANRSQLSQFSLASDDRLADAWLSRVQLAQSVDDYQDYKNDLPTVGGHYKTTQRQLTWQNTVQVGVDHQLLLGAERLEQQLTSDKAFAQTRRNVNSLFAGYSGTYGAHQVQANLREDRNIQYRAVTTGLLGYGYSINDAWRVTASYSTAFRAPTFNELYYPGYGNAALRPEHSRNVEAGVHYHAMSDQQFEVVYFDNRVRDLVNTVLVDPVNFVYQAQNVSNARMDGLEFSYAGKFDAAGVKAALTAQNPRDATTGGQLGRRARLHGSLGVTRQFGAWRLHGEWLHSGTRQDAGKTLGSYNVVNFVAGYEITRELKLTLRGDNLFNQNDATAYGYNPLGRRFYIGLSYQ